MIHINSNKGTSIFSRRPRGYVHTVVILLLLVSLTYILYMNSALKEQVQVLDEFNKRYVEKHQHLSSNLQETYERKNALENSLMKERKEHEEVKSKLEKQKYEHKQLMSSVVEEYQGKVAAIKEKHADLQTQFNRSQKMLTRITEEKQSLATVNQDQSRVIEYHKNQSKMLQESNSKLQEDFKKLSEKQSKESDESIQQMKNQAQDFNSLKEVLRKAGAEVLNLDHERFDEMSSADRMLLFTHLTRSSDVAKQLEEKRLLLHKNKKTTATSNPAEMETVVTKYKTNISEDAVTGKQDEEKKSLLHENEEAPDPLTHPETGTEDSELKNKSEDTVTEMNMKHTDENDVSEEIPKKDDNKTQEEKEIAIQQGLSVDSNVSKEQEEQNQGVISQGNATLSKLRKIHEEELALAKEKASKIAMLMKISNGTAKLSPSDDTEPGNDDALSDHLTVPNSDETISEQDPVVGNNDIEDTTQDPLDDDDRFCDGGFDQDIDVKGDLGEHRLTVENEEEIIDADGEVDDQINKPYF